MVTCLGIGAFAAVVVGISTYVVIKLQALEASDARTAFEQYKLGVAAQVAEAKREGIEAGRSAGNAILRAAKSEKAAAAARLETEKIKQAVAWRDISPESASELEKILAAKPGAVNLRYMDGDPETLFWQSRFHKFSPKPIGRSRPEPLSPPIPLFLGLSFQTPTALMPARCDRHSWQQRYRFRRMRSLQVE